MVVAVFFVIYRWVNNVKHGKSLQLTNKPISATSGPAGEEWASACQLDSWHLFFNDWLLLLAARSAWPCRCHLRFPGIEQGKRDRGGQGNGFGIICSAIALVLMTILGVVGVVANPAMLEAMQDM